MNRGSKLAQFAEQIHVASALWLCASRAQIQAVLTLRDALSFPAKPAVLIGRFAIAAARELPVPPRLPHRMSSSIWLEGGFEGPSH